MVFKTGSTANKCQVEFSHFKLNSPNAASFIIYASCFHFPDIVSMILLFCCWALNIKRFNSFKTLQKVFPSYTLKDICESWVSLFTYLLKSLINTLFMSTVLISPLIHYLLADSVSCCSFHSKDKSLVYVHLFWRATRPHITDANIAQPLVQVINIKQNKIIHRRPWHPTALHREDVLKRIYLCFSCCYRWTCYVSISVSVLFSFCHFPFFPDFACPFKSLKNH